MYIPPESKVLYSVRFTVGPPCPQVLRSQVSQPQVESFGEEIPESSKKQNWSLPPHGHCA